MSVECTSHSYGGFLAFAWLFVIITQSIPIVYWGMLLPHSDNKLNPTVAGGSAQGELQTNNATHEASRSSTSSLPTLVRLTTPTP